MRHIVFDSTELPGNAPSRKECWIDSLSSGYVRLRADSDPGAEFTGRLNILLTGDAAAGSIRGTVRSITRSPAEIAEQNTDNAVLFLNSGQAPMRIEQKGRSLDCPPGSAA